jgi:S-DNA-T family DNA segregation ATPase FtsK/SpoIIIE
MQIVVHDGTDRRELDVQLNDPDATVADLAAAIDPRGMSSHELIVDDHVVAPDLGLGECGLHDGADVAVAASGPRPEPAPPGWTLDVVGGLDAGRRVPLAAGTSVVGRDGDAGVALASDTLSRRHAEITLHHAGHVTARDLGSLNGTWLNGQPIEGDTAVEDDDTLQLGALQVRARSPRTDDRPVAVDPRRHTGPAGTIPFNRPPRHNARSSTESIEPIEPPAAPRERGANAAFNIVAFVAPLIFAAVLYVGTGQVGFLAFSLLGPVMMVGNWIQGKITGRRGTRREHERFQTELAAFRSALFDVAAATSAHSGEANPDPAEVVRRATLPSTRLWERRPRDTDFLTLRVGVGDVPWTPPVEGIDKQTPDEVSAAVDSARIIPRSPVTVELAGGGVVGIVGDRPSALAVARSLLCQAAVHHGPADLPVVVLTHDGPAWDWAKWLPHTRDPANARARLLAADSEQSTRLVDPWIARDRDRTSEREREQQHGPTLFAVVDDETLTEGRRAPVRALLRGDAGPVSGIVIAGSRDRLPSMCTTVIEIRKSTGEATALHVPGLGRRIDRFLAAGMAEDTARACAQALARFEDPELAVVGAGLPDLVRLLALLGLDTVDADGVLAQWQAAGVDPALRAPIGVADDGVLTIDLRTDGPHGLVGGTTGSGKSELLRTLVAGLAAGVDPDHLTFVLIDFKGGSAFDECARLPHTVGLVTDLDEHLAARALRCLEAELRHRERVLRDAGATDLSAYLHAGTGKEPLPRLVVIVDEFATLKAELPDFVDALIGVAQRGRSLGVHLILATQRPSGAVSDNIRANTNLRIALRVQDDGDSSDIIDRPDAARLPRHAAGRAYVRLGAGEVVAIQTALATAPRTATEMAPVDLAPFRFGPSVRPAAASAIGEAPDEAGDTDLGVLVTAIAEAHRHSGRPDPRRPWPEPLPPFVDLDDLMSWADRSDVDPATVIVGLADDPDHQTQYPVGWRPDHGNLLVYGIGGAGTTTALATIALGLAHRNPPDRVHLYAIDAGAGELAAIEPLPHTGAAIVANERERQIRLIRFLRAELDRRRQLPAHARADLPLIVVLVDGFAAFSAEYRDVAGTQLLDEFQRVFADGPEVGIDMVITADRAGAIPSSMGSLVRQRLVMRLADAYDYTGVGVSDRHVPAFPPGGAILTEAQLVIQVATPADGLAAAAARVAARHPAPSSPPPPIGELARDVSLTAIDDVAELDQRPWRIPIGIAEGDLGPARLVVHESEHALVVGPARSGKTTTLATLAETWRAACPDGALVTIAPARSPLRGMVTPDHDIAPGALDAELPSVIDGRQRSTLLLIDDADAIDDETGRLDELLSEDRPNLFVVAAGRAESLRSTFSHWTRSLRESALGVLLQPNLDLDGELLGVSLPRRVPLAMPVGRGFVVNGGELEIVQVARPLSEYDRIGAPLRARTDARSRS